MVQVTVRPICSLFIFTPPFINSRMGQGIYPTVIVVLVALRRTAWDVNYTNDDSIPSKTHVVIRFPSSDGSHSFELSKASSKPNGEV